MPGVKIGDGAIVAAYSVVSKDVEPYSIVGGNPIKLIQKRFDEELTTLLLALRWWDFEPERLSALLPILCDGDLTAVRKKSKSYWRNKWLIIIFSCIDFIRCKVGDKADKV